jgi:CRP/FNR family transcriptional regulator
MLETVALNSKSILPCISQAGGPPASVEEIAERCKICSADWAPCAVRRFQAREHLFLAGDRHAYVYVLESGTLRLYVIRPKGRRSIIDFCLAGDLIGLGTHDRHLFNAQALSASRVRCLPREAFSRYLQLNPQAAFQLYESATNRLNRERHRSVVLSEHDSEVSVACFILRLSERRKQRGSDPLVIPLPMSRSDIADYLGLSTETVSRTLTKFRKRGVIALERAHLLKILNITSLHCLGQTGAGYIGTGPAGQG